MNKPYVHLLDTIYGNYVFEVNQNILFTVDNEIYKELKSVLNTPVFEGYSAHQETLFAPLLKQGYLSDKRVEKIEHPSTRKLKALLDRKLETLTLQVTQGCNLRCSYCIYSEKNNEKQRTHSSQTMSFQTAKKAIDFFFDHAIDTEEVVIGFYGGEPLVAFDLIKRIAKYVKEISVGKTVYYTITTNGTLMTDEIIDFLVKNNVILLVSVDGPEEIHDLNRRFAKTGEGSFQTIRENLLRIKNTDEEYFKRIAVNMVIDPQNDYDLINSIFQDNPELEQLTITGTLMDDFYSNQKTIESPMYVIRDRYEKTLAILEDLGEIAGVKISPRGREYVGSLNASIDIKRKTVSLAETSAPSGTCIPGQSKLFVNVFGICYPCERVSETSEVMQIGNIYDGFDLDKVNAILNLGQLTEDTCRDCWCFTNCKICAHGVDNGVELSGELKLSQCDAVKFDVENELRFEIMKEEIRA
ncbi:MAG: radical SAM protein [Petrimonas sp.]|jgi:uncharacterized protein